MTTQQYRCDECGASFGSQDELERHDCEAHGAAGSAQGHRESAAGNYRCPACGTTFGSEEELREHGRSEH